MVFTPNNILTLRVNGWVEPDYAAERPRYNAVDDSCNGVDNDCDGSVDESVIPPGFGGRMLVSRPDTKVAKEVQ